MPYADRGSQTRGKESAALQAEAVEKAGRWTAAQAARLDMTPKEILAAVTRGWLPPDIEAVESKYYLEGVNNGLAVFQAQVRNAPVMPIRSAYDTRSSKRKSRPARDSSRNSWKQTYGPVEPRGPTAMTEAFKQAAE